MCSPIPRAIDPPSQKPEGQIAQLQSSERMLADLPNEVVLRILSFLDNGREAKEFCLLNKRFSALLPYVARMASERIDKIFLQDFGIEVSLHFKPSRQTMDLTAREGKQWVREANRFFKKADILTEKLTSLPLDEPRISSKEVLESPENLRTLCEALKNTLLQQAMKKTMEKIFEAITVTQGLTKRSLPYEEQEPSEYEPVMKKRCQEVIPPAEKPTATLAGLSVDELEQISWYLDSLDEAKEMALLNKSLSKALPYIFKVFAERIGKVNDEFKVPFHPQFTPVDPCRPTSSDMLSGLRQTKFEAFYFFRQMKEVIDTIKEHFPEHLPFLTSTKEIVENPDILRGFYSYYFSKFKKPEKSNCVIL